MPSRYICEIHDDIDEAVQKGRIDLIAGLTEEARVAGKRMEAKLEDYATLGYHLDKLKEAKAKLTKYSRAVDNIEDFLEVRDEDETSFEKAMEDWKNE